jgi:hypothetical protein
MIKSTKKSNILYIVLGILTFIFIVIALYFLFIKKKPYTCSPDNCKLPKSCQGNVCTDVGLSCVGNICTPYTCSDTNCPSGNTCVGNVCQPNDYICAYENQPNPTCVAPSGSGATAVCQNNMCFLQYENPKNTYWGCQSKELPQDPSTESSSAEWGHGAVPKYCSTNPNCIGYYNSTGNWEVATDIDPSKCTENSTDVGYNYFMYKQKVV